MLWSGEMAEPFEPSCFDMICDGSHDTFCLDHIGVPDPVSNFQTQDISEAPHFKNLQFTEDLRF